MHHHPPPPTNFSHTLSSIPWLFELQQAHPPSNFAPHRSLEGRPDSERLIRPGLRGGWYGFVELVTNYLWEVRHIIAQ